MKARLILLVLSGLFLFSVGLERDDVITPRIYGGKDATSGRYGFGQVSLQRNREHVCGGSLVAPDIVITSAHCEDAFTLIEINRYDFGDNSESTQRFNRFSKYVHPRYNSETDRFDLMLIKLDGQVSLVEPIRINLDGNFPDTATVLTVMGWGLTETGIYPDKLREVDLRYIPNDQCQTIQDSEGYILGDWITVDMLCAADTGKDACFGDSGSPLIARGDQAGVDQDVLVGVVSWGFECAGPLPGVYSRVSRPSRWIEQTICANSDFLPEYIDCSTPTPTKSPTSFPTTSPTALPTVEPSVFPTMQPTWTPSAQPSESHTQRPTASVLPTSTIDNGTDMPSGTMSDSNPDSLVGKTASGSLRLFTWASVSLALVPQLLIQLW